MCEQAGVRKEDKEIQFTQAEREREERAKAREREGFVRTLFNDPVRLYMVGDVRAMHQMLAKLTAKPMRPPKTTTT